MSDLSSLIGTIYQPELVPCPQCRALRAFRCIFGQRRAADGRYHSARIAAATQHISAGGR